MKDDSIDNLTFLDVVHVIAHPLASQHYHPSTDPAKTNLLIMVYWGTTHAPEHAIQTALMELLQDGLIDYSTYQLQNQQRERDDDANIFMLGYDSWFKKTNWDSRGTAFEQERTDLFDEIEQNRYFIVLMAYD